MKLFSQSCSNIKVLTSINQFHLNTDVYRDMYELRIIINNTWEYLDSLCSH